MVTIGDGEVSGAVVGVGAASFHLQRITQSMHKLHNYVCLRTSTNSAQFRFYHHIGQPHCIISHL